MNSLASKDFKLNGYYVAKGVIPEKFIQETRQRILEAIKLFSQKISFSIKN